MNYLFGKNQNQIPYHVTKYTKIKRNVQDIRNIKIKIKIKNKIYKKYKVK